MSVVRLPILQPTGSLDSDGRRKRIIPADVHGRFDRARKVVYPLLVTMWVVLPWIRFRGAPLVLLDVEARKFFLFGSTFNAQDGWLLFFLFSGVAFGLIYVTAIAGRVWCGWACPQTVFLEGIYRRIERVIEGSREERLQREAHGQTAGGAARTALKHAAFVVVSLLIAHVVLSYFVSLPRAWAMVRTRPSAHPEAFAWVAAITGLLYVNFAWFREQLCLIVCPYGRMQSVLLDDDSLVVGYDVKRGEPRGKKGKTTGDCVDCKRCVVVCPTGIDIRDGLQLDCLACTACIDACDEIMVKLDRPVGLIRYDSQNGLAGKPKRFARPRLLLYTAFLGVGALVCGLALRSRTDFEVKVARLPGAPYSIEGGVVHNAFDLHLVNKRAGLEAYTIVVEAPATLTSVLALPRPTVSGLGDTHVPLFVTMPRAQFSGDVPFRVRIVREGSGGDDVITVAATFLGSKS